MARYHLYLASAAIIKGPYKFAGRSDVVVQARDFDLDIKVAYRERGAHPQHAAAGVENGEGLHRTQAREMEAEEQATHQILPGVLPRQRMNRLSAGGRPSRSIRIS